MFCAAGLIRQAQQAGGIHSFNPEGVDMSDGMWGPEAFNDEEFGVYDTVLLAIGRTGLAAKLNLENAGVKYSIFIFYIRISFHQRIYSSIKLLS